MIVSNGSFAATAEEGKEGRTTTKQLPGQQLELGEVEFQLLLLGFVG